MGSQFKPETVREITSWNDFIKLESYYDSQRHKAEWVFRGHASINLALETTLDRACKEFNIQGNDIELIERDLIIDFQRNYHLHSVTAPPELEDTLEWLSLMRHHGTPTRLLDATFSLFIAVYFALENASGDAGIWAFNKSWLTEEYHKVVGAWDRKAAEGFPITRSGRLYESIFMQGQRFRLIVPVSPLRLNQRFSIQQGSFLCPGDVTRTFEQNLMGMDSSAANVEFLAARAKSRFEILRKLHRAGINRSLLFPGLDGFASSLRTKMLILAQLNEMKKSGSRSPHNIERRFDSAGGADIVR